MRASGPTSSRSRFASVVAFPVGGRFAELLFDHLCCTTLLSFARPSPRRPRRVLPLGSGRFSLAPHRDRTLVVGCRSSLLSLLSRRFPRCLALSAVFLFPACLLTSGCRPPSTRFHRPRPAGLPHAGPPQRVTPVGQGRLFVELLPLFAFHE